MHLFSHWIEIGALPSLNSHEVAKWFHNEIVCRYGLPLIVWSDKGSKYKGKFDAYLRTNGVDCCFTVTMNPTSNGLVERANRVIKSALRCVAKTCPHGHWWEVLGNIAYSFRV